MKTNYQNERMLDMIFENRNKSYGAYALRSNYNSRIAQALLITLSAIFLLGFGKFLSDKLKGNPKTLSGPVVVLDVLPEIHLDEKEIKVEPPKEQKPPQAQAISTISDPEMNVVANNQVLDSMPTNEELHTGESGLTTNTTTNTVGVTDGHGTEATFVVAQPSEPSTVLDWSEVPPVFPGGEAALMSFLQRKTVYPDRERDLEIEGKALIKFVVNEDGSISNVSVAKTESAGFGKEGVRVASMLPKFKPGMQQGKPVRVQYVLPFHFRLNR